MKYFQFNLNDENSTQKKYMQFSIDFYMENGNSIGVDELYIRHVRGCGTAYIHSITEGISPEFSCTDTKAIIVRGDIFESQNLNFSGLTTIPVIVKQSGIVYQVLWFNEFVDCVDWEHSKYEPWPEGSVLKPWHNPRGRWFWKAALNSKKVSASLDVFRLKDWSGSFNFVVNEVVKESFLSLHDAKLLTDFIELPVIEHDIAKHLA